MINSLDAAEEVLREDIAKFWDMGMRWRKGTLRLTTKRLDFKSYKVNFSHSLGDLLLVSVYRIPRVVDVVLRDDTACKFKLKNTDEWVQEIDRAMLSHPGYREEQLVLKGKGDFFKPRGGGWHAGI
ncbi:hypothetical protein GF325_15570, partial [Candidatus Bathyarchaeota archaeon]|nr:hypothetical protein [Candidatus Bathyarchaeota archaeon]